MIYSESLRTIFECYGAWWIQGASVVRAKNPDRTEGKLNFRHFGGNKEGILSAHIAKFLESEGRRGILREFLKCKLIVIVFVVGFKRGSTRT